MFVCGCSIPIRSAAFWNRFHQVCVAKPIFLNGSIYALKPTVGVAIADQSNQAIGGFIVAYRNHFINLIFNRIRETDLFC